MNLPNHAQLSSYTDFSKNNASLSQIPYNGKKTVPSALRKDLWHPFAKLMFPKGQGAIGLSVFQKLREYRKRHELEWGNDIKYKDGKLTPKKLRGRMIMDQKANSVADMAATLRWLMEGKKARGIGLVGQGSKEEVKILWRDVNDAEFAATWTSNVEHGQLEMHTNNRALVNPLLKRREAWKAKVLEEAQRIVDEETQTGVVVEAQEHVTLESAEVVGALEEAPAPKPKRWFS
jgi:hypothetical protein